MLEIRLLGQFDLRQDRETVSLPSRHAQSLFAYLVLNPGLSHRREQLAGLLAPDVDEASARGTLRHAIWRIRKSLGTDPRSGRDYLVVDDITVAFDATAR
jgi:DNA-binding SARP family transcriptional activator